MKKFLFLLLSLAVATGVNAGIVKQNFKAQKPKVQTETVKKADNAFKVDRVVEPKQMLRTPVTEQPAGEVKYYKRAGYATYLDGQYITGGEQDGDVMLIFAENNTVWIKNILYGCEGRFGDSYVYGTLSNDGTTLTVPMGQSVYWSDQYNADVVLTWGTSGIDGSYVVMDYDENVTDAVFAINGNTLTLLNTADVTEGDYPEYCGTGIGTRWTDDDSFGGLCDWCTVWTYYIPAILPTNVEVEPTDITAEVTWTGDANDNWNLRWRPYVDTSGNPINVTLPEETYMDELDGWAILDADQDGEAWGLSYDYYDDSNIVFYSESYVSGLGGLTPDNWLIAPLHKLEGVCKFKIWHYSNYPETMEVMIGMEDAIDGNTVFTDQFNTVETYTTSGQSGVEYTIDLSSYNGAMGYVVFRHYGTTNQWRLYLDDIFIGDPNAELIQPAEWIYPEENPLSVTNYTITGLTPETEYEVQVQAFNNEGDITDWTSSVNFTTLAEQNNVYIMGEVGEQDWAANAGTQMTYENGVYTATVTFDGRNNENGEEVNYFAFTKRLGANADDWATCNANRFGSETEGDFFVTPDLMGQELGLLFPYEMAYRIAKGEYKLTVDLEAMTLVIEDLNPPTPQGLRGDVDMSDDVTIADVSALIDYLLTGDATGISLQNADCDLSGDGTPDVTIADVSALIDYLLSGVWND